MTARSLGNVVHYGKVPGVPTILVKKIHLVNPTGGIPDDSLYRHSALAYEDGYADGREYGEQGKFVSSNYNREAIAQYAAGFKAGLKVREATAKLWSMSAKEVQAH